MYQTDFLFAKPGFVSGMASVLDLGGTLFILNESATPELADSRAIFSDWLNIGRDIRNAMNQFGKSHNVEK